MKKLVEVKVISYICHMDIVELLESTVKTDEDSEILESLKPFLNENKDVFSVRRIARVDGGLATFDKIYISNSSRCLTTRLLSFIILHELGHYERITKMGVEFHMNILGNEDYDTYFNGIIQEEIYADRYASFVLMKLTGVDFSKFRQGLELKKNRKDYHNVVGPNFGMIKDIETYNKAIEFMLNG